MRRSNYDKFPCVEVPGCDGSAVTGWESIAARLRQAVAARGANKTVLTIECYPGVVEEEVLAELGRRLSPALALQARTAFLPPARIDALVEPFLGGTDPVFGFLCDLTLPKFFDQERVADIRRQMKEINP
ncbi:MAG: mannose-6-phosphate isomerase, partial [Verrucomicrobia bacterium]|nr:mannose-6-phosphate isomerase [Verrucomicrobiota bacterium]